MFGTTLDVIICIIMAIAAVALLTGRGRFFLTAFRAKAERGKPLPYEEKKLSISMGILCVIMFFAELVVIFFSEKSVIAVAVAMVVVVVSFIVVIRYLRKHAKVEPEPEKTLSQKIKELERKK